MPVILAAQEAEIRRILVWSQPGQIFLKTLFHKNPSQKKKKGWWSGLRCRPWVQTSVPQPLPPPAQIYIYQRIVKY
jgi:hypothetical protein